MAINLKLKICIFTLFVILFSFVSAESYSSSNPNYGLFNKYVSVGSSKLTEDKCEAGQDFIVQISPFGCTPSVIRSDLLEEQNVPVFCQLAATKTNPLIDVNAIETISFSGKYPKEVSGVGFHPASAALGVSGDINQPILENIGYAVIVLKKQSNESSMPDFVQGNLTAKLTYDIKNAFGIGSATFYLPQLDDDDWKEQEKKYSFWNGKGYVKAEEIETDNAVISIYSDVQRISSVRLKKGESSEKISIPGFDCAAKVQIKLEGLENPDTLAKFNVNGEIVEVRKGEKFLENRCEIKSLEKKGPSEKVTLYCREDQGSSSFGGKNFNLKIEPKLKFETNDGIFNVVNGEQISNTGVYLVSADANVKGSVDAKKAENLNVTLKKGNEIKKIGFGESIIGEGVWIKFLGYADSEDRILGADVIKNYQLAIQDYDLIINNYKNEKYDDKTTYGIQAMKEKILLAEKLGQKKSMQKFCEDFKEISDEKLDVCLNLQEMSGSSVSVADVLIMNKYREIRFIGIYEPGADEYGATVVIRAPGKNDETLNLEKNKINYLGNGTQFIQLISIDENSRGVKSARVNVNLNSSDSSKGQIIGIKTLEENIADNFGSSYTFILSDIRLRKYAKVSLIPNIDNSGTSANFSFKIGIEKRAIKLSPEKTKEKIENLNKSINDWQDKSDNLGKIVKGMKGACLTTSAFLISKNFIDNAFSGGAKAIARQKVMRGEGGWYDKCTDFVSKKGEYSSIEECLADKSSDIDAAVEKVVKLQEEQNVMLKAARQSCENKKTGILGLVETEVDSDCFKKNYLNALGKSENDYKYYSVDELVDIELYSKCAGDYDFCKTRLDRINTDIKVKTENEKVIDNLASNVGVEESKISYLSQKGTQTLGYTNLEYRNIKSKIKILNKDNAVPFIPMIGQTYTSPSSVSEISDNTPVAVIVTENAKEYIATLSPVNKKYVVTGLYDSNGNKVNDNLKVDFVKSSFYQNQFKSSSGETEPVVRFYETEPYKGRPAIVPFDLKRGWYVYTKQTIPVGSSLSTYDDSGRITSFYLCNVGEDGRENNMQGDICEMINTGTGMTYGNFPGIEDEAYAKKLVKTAIQAIQDASKQGSKNSYVNIKDLDGNIQKIKVGKPYADIPDMQCQDFMSPNDCKLLFNLCDPVICPSSRCDFGGSYPVKDVIQSGIIGGIMLCFPNYQKGIYIPVCLTGIKAGIDGYISVMKSYRDCLQESLNTGKTVGVCDEIHSIYLCEFVWRQALPLTKMIVPKLIEIAFGQNIRGGGEYLSLPSAWDAAEKSVTYFTQYYAEDSFKAFKMRTAESAGEEICKNYASGVYPEGGDVLDELTNPDSPPQFHGRFDEIPFTTATVPPVSQYKVYYHIYAGQDSRVYYQVYLKEGTDSSYYQDASLKRIVASGYIARGEYVSETKDFTAPSGYKQLCIRVNDQEECGFKEVSTSFAVNYIENQYLAEQAKENNIQSEEECISGTVSAYSLINPNVQSAAESLINPQIYNQGIIRICATASPGKGTDALDGTQSSRWKDVGWCEKTKKIKCWLDTKSVKEVIKDVDTEKGVLETQTANQLAVLQSEGKILSDAEVRNKISEIKKENSLTTRIEKVNEIINKVFFNNQKSELILLRAKAYSELAAKGIIPAIVSEIGTTDVVATYLGDAETTTISGNCRTEIGNKIINFAKEIKSEKNIDDEKVKADTGADCFEQLILMQAMQESSLQHCKENNLNNCLYCDGELSLLKSGDNSNSVGVMQINKNAHKTADYSHFEGNVKYGINLLAKSYSEGEKYYKCKDINYSGWKKALRYYNGWNTNCNVGDVNYVDAVLAHKNEIKNMLPNACSGVATETTTTIGAETENGVTEKCTFEEFYIVENNDIIKISSRNFQTPQKLMIVGSKECDNFEVNIVIYNKTFIEFKKFSDKFTVSQDSSVINLDISNLKFPSGEYSVEVKSVDSNKLYFKTLIEPRAWVRSFEIVD